MEYCCALTRTPCRDASALRFIPCACRFARLQIECNPNIFPDPFKAQVFVRIWDDKFEVSSQAMLTKLTDAIKQHMAAIKAQA